jgi:hypothetical protein
MKGKQNLLIVTAVSAMVLTGCGERRDCVDAKGNKRPDSECMRTGTAGGVMMYPRFIYGGRTVNGLQVMEALVVEDLP